MVEITYRKKGVSITQVWFLESDTFSPMEEYKKSKTDILFFHGISSDAAAEHFSAGNCLSSEFHTLFSDLKEPEETLSARIHKNVRYEIRRNRKEEVEYRIFRSSELLRRPDEVSRFADMYELMYRQKGQKAVWNQAQFTEYMKKDAVLLTGIYQEENPLVYHSYIVGEKQVRLLHSVSDFRSGTVDASLVARANKRLHWEDMLFFKGEGKECYDWGGVSDPQNPNGIDAFKFKFGGEPAAYYNVYQGNSFLGKAVVTILKHRKG